MAEAWLALQKGAEGFSRPVVIKKLQRHQFRENLVLEAHMLARLNHPQLLQVIDFEERDGELLLVVEWVDGLNVAQLKDLFVQGKLPKSVLDIALWMFCFIIHQVLLALEYCHDQQPPVIHGDVTPQNILISRQGNIKLADFGIANSAKSYVNPNYAAPEILLGQSASQGSDLYQVGIVFLELLEVLPNSALLRDLNQWVRKCVVNEPEKRFASASALRQELVGWLDQKIKNSLWASAAEKELGDLVSTVTPSSLDPNALSHEKTQPAPDPLPGPPSRPGNFFFVLTGLLVAALAGSGGWLFLKTEKPIVKEIMQLPPSSRPPGVAVQAEVPKAAMVKKKAVLEVQAKPWGVVFVNTVRRGVTPQEIDLEPGEYSIEIVNPDLQTSTRKQVVLKAGKRRKILVDLSRK